MARIHSGKRDRYVCIHGHFYQPPRENPWLETVELEDSAHPYHNWNEKITAECYATNASSRILDEKGRIVRIVNNYAKISFNFGPTLLSWLEEAAPDVYGAVLEADKESQRSFSGHGSALAQPYNHMILPLANRRDKDTQVVWGVRDFEQRFGREPEGMWLPETAVDLETLDVLAGRGIRFTILAPHQASRVRSIGKREWQNTSGGKIDTTRSYTIRLPSGRDMAIFFYDGSISRAVAFEQLLKNGETLAKRLLAGFSGTSSRPQIVHIATDGETYGHHHRFGDMALAYGLHYLEKNNLARLANYGQFLEKYPPVHEVEIFENTSWSCAHGIERWRSDCGCSTAQHPEWNQKWRRPLRNALDWLRDAVAPVSEEKARSFLKDLWRARNDYIHLVPARSPEDVEAFLASHATRPLEESEKVTVLKLLEIQRHAMLMYTSCGWFFDDLSGIETIQVLRYAARVLQLGRQVFGYDWEPVFLDRLALARSNIREHGDGRRVYEKFVKPAMVDLDKVCAHYAVSSLFETYPKQTSLYCYAAEQEDYRSAEAGKAKLVLGRARMTSKITREAGLFCFGVLHLGDHNLNCGVREYQGETAYQALMAEIFEAFGRADFPETILLLDQHFGSSTYSLTSLFRDQQRRILDVVLRSTVEGIEAIYRELYEQHVPLIRYLKDSGFSPPRPLSVAAELVLNASLRRAFEEEPLNLELIQGLVAEAEVEGIPLETDTLEYAFRKNIERLSDRLRASPTDVHLLQRLDSALRLLGSLPFQVNLWKVENACYDLLHAVYPELSKREEGDEKAKNRLRYLRLLARKLSIRVS